MRHLVIGIDADGVLTDMSKFNIECGTKFFKKNPVNPDAYSVREMFECSKFEELLYGLVYFPKYCKKYSERKDAAVVIQSLNEQGHSLHEITARKFATDNNVLGLYSRNAFETWSKDKKMLFKSFQYCSEKYSPRDKLLACNKLSVDIMIEDKSDVALHLAENGIKVLLFDAPYNQEVKHENITRVKTWEDVHNIVNKTAESLDEDKEFKVLSGEERRKLSPLEHNLYIRQYKQYLLEKNFDVNKNKQYDFNFKLMHIVGTIAMVFNPVKVKGKENIPYQTGLIFASNHLDSYDQFYISKALGNRPLRGLASSSIESTFRGRLFKATGTKFVDRKDDTSKKIAEENICIELVNGNDTLIFPEGTRKNKTEEGRGKKILDFKLGTASMAQKTGSAIIPIALTHSKKFKLIKTTTINFGEPMLVKYDDNIVEKTEELKTCIETFIDNETKGRQLIKKAY